jgi:hypothetical protein
MALFDSCLAFRVPFDFAGTFGSYLHVARIVVVPKRLR